MKAIILAAGYATRLYPLTKRIAKPLLPVGGRPMVEWILDAIVEAQQVTEVHLVTNAKFAPQFEEWAEPHGVTVHNDGTRSDKRPLGAIGDIQFVIDQLGWSDDLLVIAGDNLFDFSLTAFINFWELKSASQPASAIAVYDVGDLELATHYGIVKLDGRKRLINFIEKPADPPSTLASTATYIFHRRHVPGVSSYLQAGEPPDQAGYFVNWLRQREPVYGYCFDGLWLDIGNPDQLLAADNLMRAHVGLRLRTRYNAKSQ